MSNSPETPTRYDSHSSAKQQEDTLSQTEEGEVDINGNNTQLKSSRCELKLIIESRKEMKRKSDSKTAAQQAQVNASFVHTTDKPGGFVLSQRRDRPDEPTAEEINYFSQMTLMTQYSHEQKSRATRGSERGMKYTTYRQRTTLKTMTSSWNARSETVKKTAN